MKRFKYLQFSMLLTLLTLPQNAQALDYDLSLKGLGTPQVVNEGGVSRLNFQSDLMARYQALTSEVAFALTPRMLAPAKTLGHSGFEFAVDLSAVSIGNKRPYWRGTEGAVIEKERNADKAPDPAIGVLGAHVRKGLPLGLELGGHATYWLVSRMLMVAADVRWSPLEGYRKAPDLSFRVLAGRLLGAHDFDMTVLELNAVIGKAVTIRKVATLAPYVGYGILLAQVYSSTLDKTPQNSADNAALLTGGSLYVLPSLNMQNNYHHRALAGLKLKTHVFTMSYQLDVGFVKTGSVVWMNTVRLGFDF